MKKIRVLHIVQSLSIGGLERISAQIVSGLSRERFDTELWCLTAGGPLADDLMARGVPVRVFDYKRYLLPWNLLSIARKIRRGNYDIVHTHSYPPSIVGRIAATLAGVPVRIYHYHTTSSWHKNPRLMVLEKLTNALFTDAVIACSEAVKKHVVAEGLCDGSLVSVIPNGVGKDFAHPSLDPAVRSGRTILTVASLTPHKGHLDLLRAAPAVLKRFPDARFIFVGDGPEKEKLGSFARGNGFSDNLRFAGLAADVKPYLEAADIFVLPSLREGMGISIVEAMAHRLPVIASDVGGIPEVVVDGRTGFLVKPGDHAALSTKIIELMEDREKRETLGRNGFNRFMENFTFEAVIRDLQELYLRLRAPRVLYLEGRSELSGGGQISLLNLLRKLDRKDFRPLLVCPAEGSLTAEARKAGIETLTTAFPTLRTVNPFPIVAAVLSLARLIRRSRAALVHANGSRPALYGGLAAKLTGIPLVSHIRITERDGILDTVIASLSTRIIAVSEAARKRFAGTRAYGKTTVALNGVDLSEFSPRPCADDILKELGVAPGRPVVSVIGNLSFGKGHDVFLSAASAAADTVPSAVFIIVGDGPYKAELAAKAGKSVIFAGARTDIARLLSCVDILVQPSVYPEACSRVVIESLAAGKAIIATNVGGNPELIEDGVSGILVPPGDASALSGAMIALLRDGEKRARLSQAARERAETKLGIEMNVRETESIYREILKT